MKKLLFTFIAVIAMIGAVNAQNKLKFSNQTQKGIVGTATVLFKDNTTADYSVGGPGAYSFDIGTKEVSVITIGGVSCEVGQTVTVPLSNGGTATERLLESVQDESRSFNSIIR